jgi:hypothetical protein
MQGFKLQSMTESKMEKCRNRWVQFLADLLEHYPLRLLVRLVKGRWKIAQDYQQLQEGLGLDKFRNLILTARDKHNQDSPKYQRGFPNVQFDLIGYDVLFRNAENLPGFRGGLGKRLIGL